jgi:hypothetical protein
MVGKWLANGWQVAGMSIDRKKPVCGDAYRASIRLNGKLN